MPAAYVVDDDPTMRRAIERALARVGYEIAGASGDPVAALADIPRLRPQLVVMDIDLHHELSGIDVAARLHPVIDVPVLFLTGARDHDVGALSGDDRVFGYLTKPFSPSSFRAAVELIAMQQAARVRLHDLERRYHALFDQAAVGVACLDAASGRIVEVNRKCAEILATPIAELIGRELLGFAEPAGAAACRAELDELARGERRELVTELRCRIAGAAAWLRLDASALGLPGEPSPSQVVIVQDVTDRHRAEAALERHRRLLAESQRMAGMGSFQVDADDGVMWTDGMYLLHGETPGAFTPTLASAFERIHPSDRDALVSALVERRREVTAGTPVTRRAEHQYRVLRADGELRVMRSHAEWLPGDDAHWTVVGTVQDVTREVDAAAALRESEARYRTVFHHAIGGILVAFPDGTIVDANPALVEIVGCASADELIGSHIHEWFAEPADVRLLDLDRRRPGPPIDTTWRRKDGSRASVQIDGLAVGEGDGRRFLGFLRDLTVERERIARVREAVAASRAKTDFLANMSHELRTPLNAVLGLSEALLEQTFGELNEAQAGALSTIHDSGDHLLALINDVLDIARVEAGKLSIEPEHVHVRPLVDESVALVRNQFTAREQRLITELSPELPPVDVDRRRIKQVLINLLGNAAKFSPPRAVVTVRAAIMPDHRQVEISVSDTGRGIAAADRERIFEPFVTLDHSLAREHGGAGLGLALVKRIVDLHGGSVHVESEPGAGATFAVRLPVSSSYAGGPRRARPTTGPQPARAPAAPTVLLAEDNEANLFMVQRYLERLGYAVRVVRDGAAAVAAAAAPDVDVVLMDVQLPVIDGLEATRRIRRGGHDKAIIALTAYAMPGDEERCLAAGATAYLAKPVQLRRLTETIERLIAGGGS